MGEIVLKGGKVIDKAGERIADVLIGDNGLITAIEEDLSAPIVIDVEGQIISSGLVDLNADFGQPGNENSETFVTGARSAVKGGYTAVVAMPNTHIPVDNADTIRSLRTMTETSLCHIEIAGAITMGCDGEQLAPISEMAALGTKIFAGSNFESKNDLVIRRAMEYAGDYEVLLSYDCTGGHLSSHGQINEGSTSSKLGLPGIPVEDEEITAFRLSKLAAMTGARVHLQQISTPNSVQIVDEAKSRGVRISCEVSPHHLALSEELVETFDARYKVSPPLRQQSDVESIQKQLKEGNIDAIATGHRPTENHLKEQPFQNAPYGTIGFETALSSAITFLQIPIGQVLNLLSWRPAEIAGLANSHGGHLVPGRPANLTVFDPEKTWSVLGSEMASKCSSSVFEGILMKGLVSHTLVNGELVVIEGEVQR